MTFTRYTSTSKFADVWIQMQKQESKPINFRTKIKLHGTNAAIRIVDGKEFYQNRTRDLTLLSDNAGFASFACTVRWRTDKDIIIYGEWVGPGVQKTNDAVAFIPRKMFFVFGVRDGDFMITEPADIRKYLPDDDRIFVLPWFDEPTKVSLDDVTSARTFANRLNTAVQAIGNEDPYIKELFGVSGVGEGLVVSPYFDGAPIDISTYNTYIFKVKSEAHLVQKTKSPSSSLYIEIPGSVKDFCDQFVTDNRCEQMVNEHLAGSYALQGISTFLKELSLDVIKESKNEFAELRVDWKMINRELSKRAVIWFKAENSTNKKDV
jgi:hypothetical protein